MDAGRDREEQQEALKRVRHEVRLPRFLVNEPVGLGQVVKRITTAAGVEPCTPCEQRAARLDRWLRIQPRQ